MFMYLVDEFKIDLKSELKMEQLEELDSTNFSKVPVQTDLGGKTFDLTKENFWNPKKG